MNPYLIIGIMVAWGTSLGGAFWFGGDYQKGKQAEREVLIKDAAIAFKKENQDFTDTLGLNIAKGFAGIRITNTTINNEVRHEREVQTKILDNPICDLPLTTWSLLNRARGYAGGEDRPSAGRSEAGVRSDGAPDLAAPGR